jgi:hypothetical protein
VIVGRAWAVRREFLLNVCVGCSSVVLLVSKFIRISHHLEMHMKPNSASDQPTLTLHIEGLAEDSGDLKLGVFIEKLKLLKSALRETDRILHGADTQTIDLLVADLTHSSPAAVTLRAAPVNAAESAAEVFRYFARAVGDLSSRGGGVANASVSLLEKILELCNGYGDRFSRMWLSDGTNTLAGFDSTTRESVLAALGRTIYAIGSVKGSVERYNGHGDRKYFYVYPLLGGRVKCLFENALRLDAAAAVEQTVVVHGRLFYHEGQFFPYQIQVDTIELTGETSATLASLIGSAPDATGDQSSVDFIKDNRNEWH